MDSGSAADVVLDYHESTKHSLTTVRSAPNVLDPTNMPRPWKLYDVDLPTIDLLSNVQKTGVTVDDALLGPEVIEAHVAGPTLDQLASVLQLSAGVTKSLSIGGGHMNFRAAACTGALYHIELYVICGPLAGLAAGVYHYGVHDNALRQLRVGDFRALAAESWGDRSGFAPAVTIAYTSTFWRNSWKYGSRTYRHAFWDSGTILANGLAAAKAHDLPAVVLTRFLDGQINDLVDVDGITEATVALLTLGTRGQAHHADIGGPIDLPVSPLSRAPVDYPQIRRAHEATTLNDGSPQPRAFRQRASPAREFTNERIALPKGADLSEPIEKIILKRGSSRRFARETISFSQLAAILDAAGEPTLLDGGSDGPQLNDAYVLANGVEGLEPGIYIHRPESRSLEPVVHGETRSQSGHLALDQTLGADSAAEIFFVAHLPSIVIKLGARGYRTAHLDASVRGGRVYLAAYALNLGATGLTFYDDEVITALGAPSGSGVTFLIAVGVPSKAQRALAS